MGKTWKCAVMLLSGGLVLHAPQEHPVHNVMGLCLVASSCMLPRNTQCTM